MKERVLIDKTKLDESENSLKGHRIFQEDRHNLIVEVDEEEAEELARRTGGLRSMDE